MSQASSTSTDSSTGSAAGVLDSVRARYAEGAQTQVPELCCPVDYDASLLEVLPQEIIDRDYGCGDPSRFVRKGETVLDLGSGAGKICYMASQLVGAEGRVIGVDTTDEMLDLARDHAKGIGDKIGWHNVEFRRGHIQDLKLDHDTMGKYLAKHPVQNLADLQDLEAEQDRLRTEEPLIPDGSVDLVLSNCVLNLVDNADKRQLFEEIARVLKPGGRAAISDIVSDEDVPEELQRDPELWSGCISGAMREDHFLNAFAEVGLHGVEIAAYQTEPWAVVKGIEFRSMTIVAWKPHVESEKDCHEAVIYNGPWKEVTDDTGRTYKRAERTAVSRGAFERLTAEPYAESITPVTPLAPVDESTASDFACCRTSPRRPEETKAGVLRDDVAPGTSSSSCC